MFSRIINFCKIVKMLSSDSALIEIQKGELKNKTKIMNKYGFMSYPRDGAKSVCFFPNGDRDNGIIFCIENNEVLKQKLKQGESLFYESESNYFHLTEGDAKLNCNIFFVNQRDVLKEIDDLRNAFEVHVHPCSKEGTLSGKQQGPSI